MKFHGKDVFFFGSATERQCCPLLSKIDVPNLHELGTTWCTISRHLSDCAITADGFYHLMSAIEESNLCPTGTGRKILKKTKLFVAVHRLGSG